MEVIKKGNKNYTYYVRCKECGSIISFMKSELNWSHKLDCPICKSTVYTNLPLFENDPYLGDEELKKEVEEYLANQEKTRAPMGKPAYVPNRKRDEADDKPKGNTTNTEEIKGILEELLREVRVDCPNVYYKNPPVKEDAPVRRFEPYPYEFRPYETSKTNEWSNPFCVTTANL